MRRIAVLFVAATFVLGLSGCPKSNERPEDAGGTADVGGGPDAADGTDGRTPPDDARTEIDAGRDAGADAGLRPDAGGAIVCDPVRGVECDGDWEGLCGAAGCAAGECCSPQNAIFTCVPRDAAGNCPAADIWVDTSKIETDYFLTWRNFDAADCSIVESCVDAPGRRRLLRFETWTPNTGGADLYLGAPDASAELFEYSPCHDHYHFDSYARYELRDLEGNVAATGHKQAFCLLDYFRYPEEDNRGTVYTCDNQGIQLDYQDVYGDNLDCQWVDVTDVAPGDYVLFIELNYEGVLLESDYTNNTAEIPVTIPEIDDDVTDACPPGTPDGPDRECGLTAETAIPCTPGEMLRIGCADSCGLGSCSGDPFLRVCSPDAVLGCTGPYVLGENDDNECSARRCRGNGGACCPETTVVCPSAGEVVPFWGPYDVGASATCNLSTTAAP